MDENDTLQYLNIVYDLQSDSSEGNCAQYETYTPIRFILISIATIIALLGTLANSFLTFLFTAKKNPNTPPTLYPTVLACLDSAICLAYILLFGVDAFVSYLKIESLFVMYYIYIIPAFVISRITQLAIPYMLILATLERLFWAKNSKRNRLKGLHSSAGRHGTVIVTFMICSILRLPTAFAIMVEHYPTCPDFFRTMTTGNREWTSSEVFYIFDFHVMTIAQTLVPFVLLVGLNLIIVQKMISDSSESNVKEIKEQPPKLDLGSPIRKSSTNLSAALTPLKKMSSSVRSAVFTMAAIVTSYLVSNILHLILTVLERSNHPWLQSEEDPLMSSSFHTFFSDAVSFVYMFTSAIRLLIYYACNPSIRSDIQDFFMSRREKAVFV